MSSLTKGFKEAFSLETVVAIFVAFLGYFVARLLQTYVFSKISILGPNATTGSNGIPEVADVVTMVAGAAFTHGETQTAVIIGTGLALLNDVATRFGVSWLQVGA